MIVVDDQPRAVPFIVDNPWAAVGLAFAAGALLGTDVPGRRLIWRLARMLVFREVQLLVRTTLLGADTQAMH
jgi:hypothetical protein